MFDSGLGGMSIVMAIRDELPDAEIVYFADSGRAPYGRRPLQVVRSFSEEITIRLLEQGARMIVVACNAASAAALHHLRSVHPGIPFVGMEPAVKPAAATTASGVVGVLTTAATFQGEMFASVIDRFAAGVEVVSSICDGWVELVESGVIDGPSAESVVRRHVEPLVSAGADTLVLGCTHYPFLGPVIRRVAGPSVTLIDPAPAVGRQARRVASDLNGQLGHSGSLRIETSGDPERVSRVVAMLTGLAPATSTVTFPMA